MKGKKTGGRQKGTPNADTRTLKELMAERYPGFNPVIAMAEIYHTATDKEKDLKLSALKEIAKYTHPQLKAVEHSAGDGIQLLAPLIIRPPVSQPESEAGQGMGLPDGQQDN